MSAADRLREQINIRNLQIIIRTELKHFAHRNCVLNEQQRVRFISKILEHIRQCGLTIPTEWRVKIRSQISKALTKIFQRVRFSLELNRYVEERNRLTRNHLHAKNPQQVQLQPRDKTKDIEVSLTDEQTNSKI